MSITNANKELSEQRIDCGGSFQVKLSLTAEPDITGNPTDIVLILDRSSSMSGALDSLKKAAKQFIDLIDETTDGTQDGQIGGGSRIGIVSFASTAVQDTQLITDVADLKTAVEALTAGGSTNHADAFTKALQLFDPASSNARVLVMFTDGRTTTGGDAAPIAAAAKAQGVVIYSIGLSGNGGVDEQALRDWSSDPTADHVVITPDEQELEAIFADLARTISQPGAKKIVLTDEVASCFRILSLATPTKGTASLLDPQTVQWKIDELGASRSESASLTFTVQHIGPCSGTVEVNKSIDYQDEAGHDVDFPSPFIEVDCGMDVCPEGCPDPVDIRIDGCKDAVEVDAGDLHLESLGRILQLDVTLKNVCPHRRVALAAIITEVDGMGNEHKRGTKAITVPAHSRPTCRDVKVRCIKFVLPEDLDVSGTADSICNARNFKARLIAHYIDTDFECCASCMNT